MSSHAECVLAFHIVSHNRLPFKIGAGEKNDEHLSEKNPAFCNDCGMPDIWKPRVFERNQLAAQEAAVRGWKQGQGWGWIWGKEDEVGSLNAVTPAMVLRAVSLVKQGKIYDLGVTYDRTSYKWPGHSPGEVLSFRTPEGVKRQKDLDFTLPAANPAGLAWHSSALFINDNVAHAD
jgi:hypothetical protein